MLAFRLFAAIPIRGRLSFLKDSIEKIMNCPGHLLAVESEQGQFSYRELQIRTLEIANEIKLRKIQKSCIAILSTRSFSAYCSVLASLISENHFLPISVKNPVLRNSEIIKELAAKIILFESCDEDYAQKLSALLPSTEFLNVETMKNCNPKLIQATLFDWCYVVSTSGSTGVPQSVMMGERQFSAFLENVLNLVSVPSHSRLSQTYDLVFDPSFADIFLAFTNQACLVALSPREQFNIFHFISEKALSHWSSVPSLVLLNLKRDEPIQAPLLTYTIFTGENLEAELSTKWQESFPQSQLMNFYGPVETCIWTSGFHIKDKPSHFCKIGQEFLNTSYRIINSEGHALGLEHEGELVIGGEQVCDGYFNNKNLTEQKFKKFSWDENGRTWFCTGDRAVADAEGNITILGRVDNQIKIAGQRMNLEEIEKVFFDMTHGQKCYAILIEDFVVCVVLGNPKDFDPKQILREMQLKLPPLFLPKKFYKLFEVPVSMSGKSSRREISRMVAEQALNEYQ